MKKSSIVALTFSLGILFIVLLGISGYRHWQVTQPDNYASGWDSDDVIPIMQSNKQPITPYHLFYFGQDRWGAFPMIALNVLGKFLHFETTPRVWHAVLWPWVLTSTVAVLLLLPKKNRIVGGSIWVSLLFLYPNIHAMFSSAVEGWVLPVLLFTWLGIRHMTNEMSQMSPRIWKLFWLGWAVLLGSFLTSWMSLQLLAVLVLLVIVEQIGSPFISWSRWIRRIVFVGTPVVIGGSVLNAILLKIAAFYSIARFGYWSSTPKTLDFQPAVLLKNLSAMGSNLVRAPVFQICIIGLAVLVALLILFWRQKKSIRERLPLHDGKTIIGFLTIGGIGFLIASLASWVRLNDYSDRYLVYSHLFISAAVLFGLISIIAHNWRMQGIMKSLLVSSAILLMTTMLIPQAKPFPYLQKSLLIQQALREKVDGEVLMGPYWESYLYADTSRHPAYSTIPFEGDVQRSPWVIGQLDHHNVIVPRSSDEKNDPASHPMRTQMEQYGRLYQLDDPSWLSVEGEIFAHYQYMGTDLNLCQQCREVLPVSLD